MTKAAQVLARIDGAAPLVLRRPQHYHATVYTFVSKDEHGNFVDSQRSDLVGNDLKMIEARALDLSPRRMRGSHVSVVTQCSDPAHLKGIGQQEERHG